ncbi:MAG: hypothetical protein IMZ59_05680 [Actinobacteria bacterium]|nr:hypothetical protein [Actinomycetota bacterium]
MPLRLSVKPEIKKADRLPTASRRIVFLDELLTGELYCRKGPGFSRNQASFD